MAKRIVLSIVLVCLGALLVAGVRYAGVTSSCTQVENCGFDWWRLFCAIEASLLAGVCVALVDTVRRRPLGGAPDDTTVASTIDSDDEEDCRKFDDLGDCAATIPESVSLEEPERSAPAIVDHLADDALWINTSQYVSLNISMLSDS